MTPKFIAHCAVNDKLPAAPGERKPHGLFSIVMKWLCKWLADPWREIRTVYFPTNHFQGSILHPSSFQTKVFRQACAELSSFDLGFNAFHISKRCLQLFMCIGLFSPTKFQTGLLPSTDEGWVLYYKKSVLEVLHSELVGDTCFALGPSEIPWKPNWLNSCASLGCAGFVNRSVLRKKTG